MGTGRVPVHGRPQRAITRRRRGQFGRRRRGQPADAAWAAGRRGVGSRQTLDARPSARTRRTSASVARSERAPRKFGHWRDRLPEEAFERREALDDDPAGRRAHAETRDAPRWESLSEIGKNGLLHRSAAMMGRAPSGDRGAGDLEGADCPPVQRARI